MNLFFEALKAVLFGIVEGICEWLPISSTGHMILLDEIVRLQMSEAFLSMFEVVIQLGAILAVILVFWDSIWPFAKPGKGKGLLRMDVVFRWILIVLAILPSAVVGLPLDDWLDAHLHTPVVVSIMLIVYGVAFIAAERFLLPGRHPRVSALSELDIKTALMIGLFQVLALIPGTSRSGATILGGILCGCSRAVAAEFTFLMAIPTMAGASLVKLLKFGLPFTPQELVVLAVGCVTAFIVSILTIRTLLGYIKRHSFEVFGWYRIILGLIVAIVTVIKSF